MAKCPTLLHFSHIVLNASQEVLLMSFCARPLWPSSPHLQHLVCLSPRLLASCLFVSLASAKAMVSSRLICISFDKPHLLCLHHTGLSLMLQVKRAPCVLFLCLFHLCVFRQRIADVGQCLESGNESSNGLVIPLS